MILVTGAGGKTGRALLRALSKVESVLAFVHHEDQIPVVQALGAEEVVVGDLRDPASMERAMGAIRAVYHICPNMSPDELLIGRLVIQAAQRSNVEHFVYHSVLHPQTQKMTHHWQKLHVEELLFESGLPFTIVQPAPYMQNLLAEWKGILEKGVLRVPYSVHSTFSFTDLEDVAEAARVILAAPGHRNAIYELAGTLPMSHVEVAKICSHVLRRPVRAQREEISDWSLRAAGQSEWARRQLIRMFDYYDRWGLAGNPNVLRWLLAKEPSTLEAFIQRSAPERMNPSA